MILFIAVNIMSWKEKVSWMVPIGGVVVLIAGSRWIGEFGYNRGRVRDAQADAAVAKANAERREYDERARHVATRGVGPASS